MKNRCKCEIVFDMRKIKSCVSCEEIKSVVDGEKMFDVTFNGISVPYTCRVEDKGMKIGDLSKDILAKRSAELMRVNKCYITYKPLDNVFELYHIVSFNKCHSNEIYADLIEVASGHCSYYNSIDITGYSICHDVYCEYYEIPVEFYNEVKGMIAACDVEIKGIVRGELYMSNLYDWNGLNRYWRTYKSFYNDGKSRHYCSRELAEMSISEFNDKLDGYNVLVNNTLNKMVKDLTVEFISKHRYIICDEGNHCYSVRRFNKFFVEEDEDYKEEYGYIKRYINGNGERIYLVVPSDRNATYCRVNYSTFSSRFSSLNSSGMSHIYYLSDDSLGDKLFDSYKSIYYRVLSEMYDKII